MAKTNEGIIGEQCIRSYAILAVSDEYKEKLEKIMMDDKLLKTEFTWRRNSLSWTNTVSITPCLADKWLESKTGRMERLQDNHEWCQKW